MGEIFLEVRGVKTLERSQAVSFQAGSGGVICLYGMNGSGKTLLLKALCGIHKNICGEIKYFIDTLRRGVCLQFPEHMIFKETAFEEARIITGCDEAAENLLREIGTDKNVSPFRLSGGQKRLLFIYGSLENKDLILLDEPYVSLDEDTKKNVSAKIKEAALKGKCVIYTANRKADLEAADKVINIC